jgi:hypothetical protein
LDLQKPPPGKKDEVTPVDDAKEEVGGDAGADSKKGNKPEEEKEDNSDNDSTDPTLEIDADDDLGFPNPNRGEETNPEGKCTDLIIESLEGPPHLSVFQMRKRQINVTTILLIHHWR